MPSDPPISHDSFERTALRCTPQSWTVAEIAQFVANLGLASTYAPLDSPEFTTPVLGVATATSINKVTITAPATSAVLTIANGKTLTASVTMTLQGGDASVLSIAAAKTLTCSNTLTFTGTDAITVAFGGGLSIAATKVFTVSNTITLAGTDSTTYDLAAISNAIAAALLNDGSNANLPTVDPVVAGALWCDTTADRVVKVSAG